MTGITMRRCSSWALLSLLAINLALIAGCSGTTPTQGSNCYAKALPTAGTGGLAWGSSLNMARKKSLDNCKRYAGRSGGTPSTCEVVLAKCKR
ncbi:MAG TPA: hypothetical protein VF671_22340 [Pseudomonas sp.]|jgi:hypothetical protein|uniref:hypothetical protein n=1 Tax=Pseudomonas sp. TaxID=306 RepID=UPI002ED7FB24